MIQAILAKLGYRKPQTVMDMMRDTVTAIISSSAQSTAHAAVHQYNVGLASGRMQGFSEAVLMVSRAVYDRSQVIGNLEVAPAEQGTKDALMKALYAVLQDVQFIQANYAKGDQDAKENAEEANADESDGGDAGSAPGSGEGDAQNDQESAGDSGGNPPIPENPETPGADDENGTVVDNTGDRAAR